MESFLAYATPGFATGSLYALVALGLVLVYRATRTLNFAHGDISALVTFFAYTALSAHIPFAVAFLIAVILGAGVAALFYRFVLLPARRRGGGPVSLLILTLAAALILQGVTSWIWGTQPRVLPFPLSDSKTLTFGPVVLSHLHAGTLVVAALAAALLYILIQRTRTGLAMRALALDVEGVQTLGIPARKLLALTWALSAVLGGTAGVFLAPVLFVDPYFMLDPFLKGFAAAVVGGLDSLPGAVLGGLLLGVAESLFGGFISIKFKATFVFVVIVVVLLVRPEGLLGKVFKERV
ncbi:MAG: branched-chain amino acid ABC transporter permease [Nitrospirae bacterium]|nr:branched-chain amino acid ABC transporter permease [Nitrospirota bacterium]